MLEFRRFEALGFNGRTHRGVLMMHAGLQLSSSSPKDSRYVVILLDLFKFQKGKGTRDLEALGRMRVFES